MLNIHHESLTDILSIYAYFKRMSLLVVISM